VKLSNYNHKTVNSTIYQRQAADLENRASDKHLKINTSMEPTPSISKPHLVTSHMLSFNEIKIPKTEKYEKPIKKNLCIDCDYQISKCHSSSENIKKDLAIYV
jgi:hypothetical protein